MAKTLDDLLQPRERVLWQDLNPRLFDDWLRVLGAAFLISGMVTILSGHGGLALWGTVFGIVLAVWMLGETIKHYFLPRIEGRTETVLTTDRLLQRHRYARDNILEVSLAEVAEIKPNWSGGLTLAMRDGSTAGLYDPRRPHALAAAMVEAADLPPPRLTRHLAGLWHCGQEIGTPVCFFLGAVLLPDLIAVERGGDLGIGFMITMMQQGLQILVLLVAAAVIGQHLTTILGLAVLRPWVSAAEAYTWLDLSEDGVKRERAWSRSARRFLRWPSPFYGRLVRLLWGEPTNGPNAGATRHG